MAPKYPAKEYSNMLRRTGIRVKSYDYIKAIVELRAAGDTVPNLAIAEKIGRSPVSVGSATKQMERTGVLENISTHPLYKDWKLTALGEELYGFIKTHEA